METLLINSIDPEKFRLLLQSEYDLRKSRNPNYSLRSFANHLDISSACLSVILRGKRPLTPKLIERFINQLSFGPDEITKCISGEDSQNKTYILTMDTFAIISQWYHDAILDLIKLDDFQPDIAWIAKTLEISNTEVNSAVERLERCDLIKRSEEGWELLEQNTDIFVDDITSAGLKKLQREVLEISKEKVDSCPVNKRYHSTLSMAINVEDLPKAKQLLRDFRKTFCANLESTKKKNDVYELQIGFFPLTNLNNAAQEAK